MYSFFTDNSELKRRLKAEQKAKEKETKQSQKVLPPLSIRARA